MNNRITILVIEDDSDISNMIRDMLKHNGYGTKQAYSGTEALMVFDDKLI
jgi:DNA-binding response OmpR family regulator